MRSKRATKRKISADPKHNNIVIQKFINQVMRRGKKTVAQSVVYGSFDFIKEKTNKNPVDVFDQAIRNVSPVLEVKSRRIGGANYQIPMEVKPDRRLALAMRWIIGAAQSGKGKPMREKLGQELIDAANNQG